MIELMATKRGEELAAASRTNISGLKVVLPTAAVVLVYSR
jgi:hypothetical protein